MKMNIFEKLVLLTGFVLMSSTFVGCRVVSDIFKSGFWIGIIVVVIILIIVFAIIRMLKR
jgi:hypothetical protein